MDEAIHFGHHDVVTILRDYHNQYSPQDTQNSDVDKQNAEKNLDGMLWAGWAWTVCSEEGVGGGSLFILNLD